VRYTKYDSYRNNELLREVDANPNATELEIELAKRLERTMKDSDFRSRTAENLIADRSVLKEWGAS
jgi:hypothetical protein